jgi:hypothetical protein
MPARDGWPDWVKLGLYGLSSRAGALGFAGFSVAGAIGCAAYAVTSKDPRFFAGLLLLLAAAWYVAAVRWVDRNGTWE